MVSYSKRHGTISGLGLSRRFQCGAGSGVISVDPFGNVYPCHALHQQEFLCGNVLTGDLKKIYDSKPMRICRETTVDSKKECSSCDLKYVCGGGCLATTYKLYGSLKARNELLCPFYRKIAIDSLWDSTR
jgi:radical SAM protein with 4Fe4S-binding SPASM domain